MQQTPNQPPKQTPQQSPKSNPQSKPPRFVLCVFPGQGSHLCPTAPSPSTAPVGNAGEFWGCPPAQGWGELSLALLSPAATPSDHSDPISALNIPSVHPHSPVLQCRFPVSTLPLPGAAEAISLFSGSRDSPTWTCSPLQLGSQSSPCPSSRDPGWMQGHTERLKAEAPSQRRFKNVCAQLKDFLMF